VGADISIVIPVYRDDDELGKLLAVLKHWGLPIIVVDGESDSATSAIVAGHGQYIAAAPGRGGQIAAGVECATTSWLWVLHADSRPSKSVCGELLALVQSRSPGWGRCNVTLPGLRAIAWWMNWRSRVTKICTGDQGMFFHRQALDCIGGFPALPLMEDIEASKRLKRTNYAFYPLRGEINSSPRRWAQNGVLSTVCTMWLYRLRYFFGVSAQELYATYYGGTK